MNVIGFWTLACSMVLILASWRPPGGQSADNYVLPFLQGTGVRVLQGYNGPWGHQGHAALAYDFQARIGSEIIASRGGEVVHLVEHHKDSTRTPGEENVVVLKHADGSFGRYYHLTTDGVLVALGDRVVQGQRIALSGDSGASAGPHLHFDVTKDCHQWGRCQTIPIVFSNVNDNPLKQGSTYVAGDDEADRRW